MRAGSDFWNDAAIAFKNINLRNYNIGKNNRGGAIRDDSSSGLVTGRFNSKNIHKNIITYFEESGREDREDFDDF